MRTVVVLVLLVALGARAQGAPGALEITQRFAANNAPQIALARVEQMQPSAPSAPRWSDWEQLRCALLSRLNRHQELARRVAALPPGVPDKVTRACVLLGARAALAAAQGAAARELLARLLWRFELSVDEMRQARLLVIDAYLTDGRPQDAYALMLRFQQDYRPLDRDTAAHFVDALIAAGMEKEAVNWFAQLDDAGPQKLLMRLKTNLLAPDAAVAQARAALARSNQAAYWVVLQQAGALQKDRTLQVEALENILQLARDEPAGRVAATAAELWQAYFEAAQDIANRNQLLVGDDAGWADFAARRSAANSSAARAMFAYLAQKSRDAAARHTAQLQLAFSLQGAKLALTATRLFDDVKRLPPAELDPQARFLLGSMAVDTQQAAAAARYWQGLATPPTLSDDEWQVRLGAALVHAGATAPGADALRRLVAGKSALPADIVRRAVAAVQELEDGGEARSAAELYRALSPLAAARERRDVLTGLGRLAEAAGEFRAAADHFMEAALMVDAGAPDAVAIGARLAGAANLARAGYKDDARAQFKWLQQNVKDADRLDFIRREMQKL